MAYLAIGDVRIAGFSAGVPKNILKTLENADHSDFKYPVEDLVKATGVREIRHSDTLTTSDLCCKAAEKLIADLRWAKDEIDALLFVSQTPDYILPATACILQHRLGLNTECLAEDVSLGCSGWVYGLGNAASLVSSGTIRKALLLAGDAKCVVPERNPLYGHAGTATALEYSEGSAGFKFHLGTDGSGYDAIIVPDGGCRNGITEKSFALQEMDGRKYTRIQGCMKGMDVFAFGITAAPESVRRLAAHFGFDYLDRDYFVFHQANSMLNGMIAKKLKLPPEKVPSSIHAFGNTSSASIPLTITTQLKEAADRKNTFICCGFGVGLSWGTVAFETDHVVISDLVEVGDEEVSSWI